MCIQTAVCSFLYTPSKKKSKHGNGPILCCCRVGASFLVLGGTKEGPHWWFCGMALNRNILEMNICVHVYFHKDDYKLDKFRNNVVMKKKVNFSFPCRVSYVLSL